MDLDRRVLADWVAFPHGFNVLHDAGLKRAMADGKIRVRPEPDDSQIQPASLDIKLGKARVYDARAMARTGTLAAELFAEDIDAEIPTKFAIGYPDEKGLPITIPPGAFVEAFSHNKILFSPDDYEISFDLRSSRGRIHLSPEIIPGVERNRHYVSFRNESNKTVILYGHDPFAQAFFHPRSADESSGFIVQDEAMAAKLAGESFQGMPEMFGAYVVFRCGEKALRLRDIVSVIDTRKKYKECELYEEVSLPFNRSTGARPRDALVVQLEPVMRLPPNVGLRILHSPPYLQGVSHSTFLLDEQSANAGWIDPGYEGKATAHIMTRIRPPTLQTGMPLAFGVFYYYTTPVDKPYGSEGLNSHYQKSEGAGVRS